MTDTPNIYVASLSDYNGGKLHGVWIDATDELDEIHEQIKVMLAASPEFKEFPQGGPAEEYAIHDYSGFGALKLGEYDDIERVHKIACAIGEHGQAVTAWLELSDDNTVDDFEEHFRGQHDSDEDFARATVSEIGWASTPAQLYTSQYGEGGTVNVFEALESYLDWEHIARDLIQHGNYSSTPANEDGGGVYIFEDEV